MGFGTAVEAEGGAGAVEAVHVAFAAGGVGVGGAGGEEGGGEEWL